MGKRKAEMETEFRRAEDEAKRRGGEGAEEDAEMVFQNKER